LLAHSLGLTGKKVPIDQTYAQYKTELTPWLSDCPSQILRNSAVIWYQAYQKYLRGLAGRPKRKKKGDRDYIWLTSELFSFEDGKLFIGQQNNHIGSLSFAPHREYQLPKSIWLSRKNGEWFVSFCYDDGAKANNPVQKLKELSQLDEISLLAITDGADRGVTIPLQTTTQSFDFTPQQKASIAKQQKIIEHQQKKLSGQQKGSHRREQTKYKIAKAHNKIANIRKDFAHQTSRKVVDSESEIFVFEDLKTKNMSTAAKPKQADNGRYLPNGSKAKAALNAAILQSAWGIMVRYTAYKAIGQNKVVIKLPPQHTSQECAHCGYIHPDNRQSQAKFVCLNCG
jgi:putative transposase